MSSLESINVLSIVPIDPCEAVALAADAIGAWGTAREARQPRLAVAEPKAIARSLCIRLERFLLEEQQAMSRAPEHARRHSDAVVAWMEAFDDARAARLVAPDPGRDVLVKTLDRARRRLLMESRVDLWDALARYLDRAGISTQALRELASTCARELAYATLVGWHRRLRPLVDAQLATAFHALLATACAGAPSDVVATNVFAGLSVSMRVEVYELPEHIARPSSWERFTDHVRPRTRARDRVIQAAAERLDATIELESRRIADTYLDCYDRAIISIGDGLARALDQFATHLVVAAARARDAKAAGPDGVTRAYERIDAWFERIAELRRRIES